MRKSKQLQFPWAFWVDEDAKLVYVHIPGGYPTTLGAPRAVSKYFPGYAPCLCTKEMLQSLIAEQTS